MQMKDFRHPKRDLLKFLWQPFGLKYYFNLCKVLNIFKTLQTVGRIYSFFFKQTDHRLDMCLDHPWTFFITLLTKCNSELFETPKHFTNCVISASIGQRWLSLTDLTRTFHLMYSLWGDRGNNIIFYYSTLREMLKPTCSTFLDILMVKEGYVAQKNQVWKVFLFLISFS